MSNKNIMSNKNVMILEGNNGLSFFLHESLLGYGLADCVETVHKADEAIDLICESGPFSLVVINLAEAWEQGIHLGFWLKQQAFNCPIILITPQEQHQPVPFLSTPFIVLPASLSLEDFIRTVRSAFQVESNFH